MRTARILIPYLAFLACLAPVDRPAVADSTFVVRPLYDERPAPGRQWFPHKALKRPRIGLVLSGGGARGVAQIGVLKALERNHIPVDFIAATSMGAIVGGLYASGYNVAEIERLALTTNWDDVLSLSDETERRQLFVDQKLAGERSFLAVRFKGLAPVLPSAVSLGQRLTDFLSTQILQAVYHGYPTFDDLKIPFRAVSTDLISGKRVVLKDGSLAEALRASATTPLLFSPIEKDGMRLVDGGLVDNVPVDVAREAGCDIVIVVNSTSGLRSADEMKAPWQTADQIAGIMMQVLNNIQLRDADVVITPDIGGHLSSNFRGLDSLILKGERSAEEKMAAIGRLVEQRTWAMDSAQTVTDRIVRNPSIVVSGGGATDSLRQAFPGRRDTVLSVRDIRLLAGSLVESTSATDVEARVTMDSAAAHIEFFVHAARAVTSIACEGARVVPAVTLTGVCAPLLGKPLDHRTATGAMEDILREYRRRGYSLAAIDTVRLDPVSGGMTVVVNEGVIDRVDVQGGERTQDNFVLSEFPLQAGDVFQIDRAKRGISNISSTTLFEYVYLEIAYQQRRPLVTIRLRERPSQLVRFGIRADNERNLQGSLDLRDENFHGGGTELGLTVAGGDRNVDAVLEYKARRLFNPYLTFTFNAFYRTLDSYLYTDALVTRPNRWDRVQVGDYRDRRYGAGISFGGQLERLGNATVEYVLEDVRVTDLDRAAFLEDHYRLGLIRVGTIVDTKDSYPFPTAGIGLNLSYEFAFQTIGSDVGYNALRIMYEGYSMWGNMAFHPRFSIGFADKTMPFSQQFRLGGRDTFFGLREDDRRGRQMLLLNMEFRYKLPIALVFDTYLRARYDLGTISALPEEIKFSTLRHGVGAEIAFGTPVGPASLGLGKSFYLGKNLPDNPVQQGPFLFYFMIGYQL
jgi:NTE family protein